MQKVLPSGRELKVLSVCKKMLICKTKWMQNACRSKKKEREVTWEKTRSSESILKKKGAKNANFPENRGLQERISKTREDRGLFGKKLGSEWCFKKRVCFKRGFKTKRKAECNFKKTGV